MNHFTSLLKRIHLRQVVVVFMAGILLVLSTACNPPAPRVSGEGSYNQRAGQETTQNWYTTNQPRQGGMNEFDDVDARRDTVGPANKARALSREAEQNIQKVEDPEDFAKNYREGTPLGERVRNITENVGESVEEVTEGVSKGTQRGVRNLQRNTSDAAENVQESTERAGRNVSKSTQRAAEDATDYAQERVRDTTKATQRAVEDAADAVNNRA